MVGVHRVMLGVHRAMLWQVFIELCYVECS